MGGASGPWLQCAYAGGSTVGARASSPAVTSSSNAPTGLRGLDVGDRQDEQLLVPGVVAEILGDEVERQAGKLSRTPLAIRERAVRALRSTGLVQLGVDRPRRLRGTPGTPSSSSRVAARNRRPSRSAGAARAAAPGRRPGGRRRSTRSRAPRAAGGGSRARSGAPRRGSAAAAGAPASGASSTIGSDAPRHEHLLDRASRARSPRRAAGRRPASPPAPPTAGPCRRRSRRGSAAPRTTRRRTRPVTSCRAGRSDARSPPPSPRSRPPSTCSRTPNLR